MSELSSAKQFELDLRALAKLKEAGAVRRINGSVGCLTVL
jgi:hypothetical protein